MELFNLATSYGREDRKKVSVVLTILLLQIAHDRVKGSPYGRLIGKGDLTTALCNRRELKKVAHQHYLETTEGLVTSPNLFTYRVNGLKSRRREHRDFLNY